MGLAKTPVKLPLFGLVKLPLFGLLASAYTLLRGFPPPTPANGQKFLTHQFTFLDPPIFLARKLILPTTTSFTPSTALIFEVRLNQKNLQNLPRRLPVKKQRSMEEGEPSSPRQVGSQQKFPVRSRVRPSKAPPRSPSLGSVATICRTKRHKHHQLSLQLPSTVLPLLPRHHCRRAPLLLGTSK
jgi:hypothetical protein